MMTTKYPRCSYTALESMNKQADTPLFDYWYERALTSIYKNQPSTSKFSKLIISHKGTPNSSLFPTLKSTLKFEVFHPTSEVTEVKGGPKKKVRHHIY